MEDGGFPLSHPPKTVEATAIAETAKAIHFQHTLIIHPPAY